ncbi:hypothetical protein Ga0609869_000521 [Rhodovulum iodosum]|uniref:SGNH/GDSL hydrolase family protein n=1 Tax=Rhodovulum iodosum TaxID=68291 RepID=A0ABV3XRZ9_9RHOB|nr:hypothetical protein [Rhodovulum robiginosum]RSK31532.1 hypothetical protein EJA01_15485 [Rhodovulum robiginosum]
MKDILIIGHSHIFALFSAHQTGFYQWQNARPRFVRLRTRAYRPELVEGRLNPAIQAELEHENLAAVFTLIGGNVHSALGLTNHPQPFDLILPDAPDLPLIEGAEILPYALVQEVIAVRSRGPLDMFDALAAATDLPVWQVEPPPPVASEKHIRQNPAEFADVIAERGVSPPALRYKLWRVHTALLAARGARHGAQYLPVPPDFCDSQGMLRLRGCADDPVHAAVSYGKAVLAQIDALAAGLE